MSGAIPRVDLPDLKPFLEISLAINGRKIKEDAEGIGFLTPDEWKDGPGVREEYRGLSFDRTLRARDAATRVVGVGHKALDRALAQAANRTASLATVPKDALSGTLSVFRIRDRVTGQETGVKSVVVGVEAVADSVKLLLDWELLARLNQQPVRKVVMGRQSSPATDLDAVAVQLERAETLVRQRASELGHPFRHPEVELVGLLCPQ